MLRPRANEIRELIQNLGRRSKTAVDAARARLAVVGAQAAEPLIEALEDGDDRIRARIMPLLALIQDPRGREPLVAMLLDRNVRLREVAARCLGRFPSAETVAALNRAVRRDRSHRVRVAGVQSLVDHYATGQDLALGPLLDVLADGKLTAAVRVAAFPVLPLLRASERRSIAGRLERDGDSEVRRRAAEAATAAETGPRHEASEIDSLLGNLGSDDYALWNEAVQRLTAACPDATPALLGEMRRRAHDPEYCTRAGMVLRGIGPRRAGILADALETLEEPLPLQVLVESIGALGEKSMIYRLKDLIERLSARPVRAGDADGFDLMPRVRAKAHLELARVGSRVAIRNLRDCLADPERRVDLELVGAVQLIGKREEIGVLLRAHVREDDFTRERIADAVRAIMKRERIRRNNRMFQTLGPAQQQALRAILPPTARAARRRRASGADGA